MSILIGFFWFAEDAGVIEAIEVDSVGVAVPRGWEWPALPVGWRLRVG
jgi:hypothetical protein